MPQAESSENESASLPLAGCQTGPSPRKVSLSFQSNRLVNNLNGLSHLPRRPPNSSQLSERHRSQSIGGHVSLRRLFSSTARTGGIGA